MIIRNSICKWQVATAQTTVYLMRYMMSGEHSYVSNKLVEELNEHT